MGRMPIPVSLIALAPLGVVGLAAGPATAETTCDGKVPSIVAVPGTPTAGTPSDDVILGTYARDEIDGVRATTRSAGSETPTRWSAARATTGCSVASTTTTSPTTATPATPLCRVRGTTSSTWATTRRRPRRLRRPAGELRQGRVRGRAGSGHRGPLGRHGDRRGHGHDRGADLLRRDRGLGLRRRADRHERTRRIRGGGGDDRIHALDGDDNIEPGKGDDVVRGGDGGDAIVSPDKGRDRLYGDDGKDFVEARGRGSAIGGGAGDDYLVAHLGATVHGGPGDDEIGADLTRRTRTEVDGGGGRRDVVRLRAPKSEFPRGSRYVIDVPRKRVTVGGAERARYEGVEDVRFSGRPGSLTYLGGPGRDRLSVSGGMQVKGYGRRGADILVGGSRTTSSSAVRSRPARRWFRAGPVHRRRAATAVRGAPLTRSERGPRTGHAGAAYRRGGAAATRGLWPRRSPSSGGGPTSST